MANAGLLTSKEREKLFLFLLSSGPKMVMSTRCLLRDFTEKILEDAFADCQKESLEHIRKSYFVSVDYQFIPEEILNFHNSLSPKVTFGYSNQLHEECTFALTDERKKYIEKNMKINSTFDFYGAFYLGDYSGIYYEDTVIWIGEKVVFECVSHESMMDVYLDEETERLFLAYKGERKENARIMEKLKNSESSQFLVGQKVKVFQKKNTVTLTDDRGVTYTFIGTKNKYDVQFNTDLLGGDYQVNERGEVRIVGQQATKFQNGKTYTVNDLQYHIGVQGDNENLPSTPVFCELFLCLRDLDGNYCDITLSAEEIYCKRKMPKPKPIKIGGITVKFKEK